MRILPILGLKGTFGGQICRLKHTKLISYAIEHKVSVHLGYIILSASSVNVRAIK